MSRWKFHRRRIGKFANSAWYLISEYSQTTSGLAAMIAPSSSRLSRSCVQSCAGGTSDSQSTIRPSIANSRASNAAMIAVQNVIAKM